MTQSVVSKAEFARLTGVTPTRVGQWLREGKIGPDAIEGEGRHAKIKVDLAKQQIGGRMDPGQRFGNGLFTQLDAPAREPAPARAAPTPDPVAAAIGQERLRSLRLANERAVEERLAEQGRYVRADITQAAMNRMAAGLLTIFEGGLADLAAGLAAKYGLVQRDVLHQLRAEFRTVRIKALEAHRRDMAGMNATMADEIPDATDPALGEA